MNFTIQSKDVAAIKEVVDSTWQWRLSNMEDEFTTNSGIILPPVIVGEIFDSITNDKQKHRLELVFPNFGDQKFEKILGRDYPVGIMPDGKEWTLCNLIYPEIGVFYDGIEFVSQTVEGTLHSFKAVGYLNKEIQMGGSGFRVAASRDWTVLEKAIGSDAGTKLKSRTGWNNNGNGTDDFGFSVFPAGFRQYDGSRFSNRGFSTYFWSASISNDQGALYRELRGDYSQLSHCYSGRSFGFSVRCVRDSKC